MMEVMIDCEMMEVVADLDPQCSQSSAFAVTPQAFFFLLLQVKLVEEALAIFMYG